MFKELERKRLKIIAKTLVSIELDFLEKMGVQCPWPSIGNFNDPPNVTLLIQRPLFASGEWTGAANVALSEVSPF